MTEAGSPQFAFGSVLESTTGSIHLTLSNTCMTCSGGESIVLAVTPAVPEPTTWALVGAGLPGLGSIRRRMRQV